MADMPSSIPRLTARRPPALTPAPPTPISRAFSDYQMGPLTPAPFRSPLSRDTFGVDPLDTPIARPPLRPFPSLQPPHRAERNQQLLLDVERALSEERLAGVCQDVSLGLWKQLGHAPQDVRRYMQYLEVMQEDQKLAREGDIRSAVPLYMLLLALGGRFGIGMGATFLEHELLPGQPTEPGSTGPSRLEPSGGDPTRPISNVQVMAGAMLLAGGSIASLTATWLFWRQARIKRPVRANCLAALHITSLMLVVLHSFLYEWVLFNRPADKLIFLTAPLAVSTALYGYTVVNSLTAAEIELGLIPIKSMEWRVEIAMIIGTVALATKDVGQGLASVHGTSSYIKQAVSILANLFYVSGMGLAISTARNYKNRHERGKKLEQRARLSLSSDNARGSNAVRRPTAMPAQIARHLPLEQRIARQMDEEARTEGPSIMLRPVPAAQQMSPAESWGSPDEGVTDSPAGARPVSSRVEDVETDYFTLRHRG